MHAFWLLAVVCIAPFFFSTPRHISICTCNVCVHMNGEYPTKQTGQRVVAARRRRHSTSFHVWAGYD